MYINAKNDRFVIQLDGNMKYFLPPVLYIRPESLNKSAIIKHMPHCFRVNFTKRTLIIRDNPHLANPTISHPTINIDFCIEKSLFSPQHRLSMANNKFHSTHHHPC